MKPKKGKINIENLKEKAKNIIFTQEGQENLESLKKKWNSKGKYVAKKVLVCLLLINVLAAIIVISEDIFVGKENKKDTTEQKNVISKNNNEKKKISYDEEKVYMIDSYTDKKIKILPAKLDDKVAYSISYGNKNYPKGELEDTLFFKSSDFTTLLLNGYPNVSYEKLGLKNEEEAYMATQLALYQMVSTSDIEEIKDSKFSLKDVKPISYRYKDMVERVVSKANELVEKSRGNIYVNKNTTDLNDDNAKSKIEGNDWILGPIKTKVETDAYYKSLMGDILDSETVLQSYSFFANSEVKLLDKDLKEVSKVKTGEEFYLKVTNYDKSFAHVYLKVDNHRLETHIYTSGNKKNKYMILEDNKYKEVHKNFISNNVEYGTLDIDFLTEKGKEIKDVGYYIYDENNKLIHDASDYGSENIYKLPVGKYYIKQYSTEKGFLKSDLKYEVNIKQQDYKAKVVIINSHLETV